MPTSYRDPDERDGDQVAYFDYEGRATRVSPWRDMAIGAAVWSVGTLRWAWIQSGSALTGLAFAGIGAVIGAGLGYLASRMRSGPRGALVVHRRPPAPRREP